MNKTIIGIFIGLLIASSVVYAVETYDELIMDQDILKGPFFLIVVISHGVMIYLMYTRPTKRLVIITIIGTIILIILYALSTDSLDEISHLGLTSKLIQGATIVTGISLYQKLKNNG
jgi:xanthine/uracil/vitamin C permease (AzgA family)